MAYTFQKSLIKLRNLVAPGYDTKGSELDYGDGDNNFKTLGDGIVELQAKADSLQTQIEEIEEPQTTGGGARKPIPVFDSFNLETYVDANTEEVGAKHGDTLVYILGVDAKVTLGDGGDAPIMIDIINASPTGSLEITDELADARKVIPVGSFNTKITFFWDTLKWTALQPGAELMEEIDEPPPPPPPDDEFAQLLGMFINQDESDVVGFAFSAAVSITNLKGLPINGPYHFTQIVQGTNTTLLKLRLNDHYVPGTDLKVCFVREYGNIVDHATGIKVAAIGKTGFKSYEGVRPNGLTAINTYNGDGTLRVVGDTSFYDDRSIAYANDTAYANANAAIAAAAAGDWVLVAKNAGYNWGIDITSKNGTSSNYITVCGFGDLTDTKPVLTLSGSTHGVYIRNSDYIHVDGFYCNGASNSRVFELRGDNVKNYVTGNHFMGRDRPETNAVIQPDSVPGTPPLDVNFLFNEVKEGGGQVMKVVYGLRVTDGSFVSFNKIHDGTNDCLRFIHEEHTIVDQRSFKYAICSFNELTNSKQDLFDCFAARQLYVEHNWVHHAAAAPTAGNGIKAGGQGGTVNAPSGEDIVVRYNWVHDMPGFGITSNNNNQCNYYGNLVERCGTGIDLGSGSAGPHAIDNNTVVACNKGLHLKGTGTTNVRNNIIQASGLAVDAGNGTKAGQNNLFIGGSIAGSFTNQNGINSSLGAVFVDAAARNYRLRANSPAINAGVANAAYSDIGDTEGNAISGAIDRGCFEYTVAPTTPQQGLTNRTAWGIGDSTMRDPNTRGWMEDFQNVLRSQMTVNNRANPGESATSYLELDLTGDFDWPYTKDRIQAGDYVFIAFGHNNKPGTGSTENDTMFEASLLAFIEYIRDTRQGIPVLVTPPLRRLYSGGSILPETNASQHGNRPQIIRDLGTTENVQVIDLSAATFAIYSTLTYAQADSIFGDGSQTDNTHFGTTGALHCAYMVRDLINAGSDDVLKAYMNTTTAPPINLGEDLDDPTEGLTLTANVALGGTFNYVSAEEITMQCDVSSFTTGANGLVLEHGGQGTGFAAYFDSANQKLYLSAGTGTATPDADSVRVEVPYNVLPSSFQLVMVVKRTNLQAALYVNGNQFYGEVEGYNQSSWGSNLAGYGVIGGGDMKASTIQVPITGASLSANLAIYTNQVPSDFGV